MKTLEKLYLYFTLIDNFTGNKTMWTIVVHRETENTKLINNLTKAGINKKRIRAIPSTDFFDLDDIAATRHITELRYNF